MSAPIGQFLTPAQAMRLAIGEGSSGLGFVAPNPLVGCAIVDAEHRLLALGAHRKVGEAHAEIDALKRLSRPEQIANGHMYVTLEPCAHQGRTPSCALTLAPLKPASVTYAVEDPNPLVSGKGAEILRQAGVRAMKLSERDDIPETERLELIDQAEDLAEIFLHNHRVGEPFVAVKVASSLDGIMAYHSGESKWITGPEARVHGHLLRARYDATVIGRGTFAADDPALNVRHPQYPGFRNQVVLLDPKGQTLNRLAASNLLRTHAPEDVIVVTANGVSSECVPGVRVIQLPVSIGHEFEIPELLRLLKSEGLTSLMIEGGSRTYGAFFRAQRVRRIHAFLAPLLLGGRHGLSWSAHFGGESMAERLELERVSTSIFGKDLYFEARVGVRALVN